MTAARPHPAVPELAGALAGRVTGPRDAAYDELRRVHNAMIDKRPAVIVQPVDENDIVIALRIAKDHGLDVSVRGGGHAPVGFAICEGGVVIDTRGLTRCVVDAPARRARVGAGLTWGQLDAATQEHGLAVTGGRVSSTGVVGLTLGSGSGWLERMMGLAADNLVGVRLVTADGRVVEADERHHPDLLWAHRGGGGNFGVVTEVTFALRPVGPTVLGGLRMYPVSQAKQVLRAYREVMAKAPDELCGGVSLLTAPPAPFVPEPARGKPVLALLTLWSGPLETAREGIAPLDALGEPVVDLVEPMPYTALQRLLDKPDARNYFTAGFLAELSDESIDALMAISGGFISPMSQIILQPLGGAYARGSAGESALGHRDAGWAFQVLSQWTDPERDAENLAWTRAAKQRLAGFAQAAGFSNFVADDGPASVRVAYGDDTLRRLVAVKRAWDPENVFRHNHNIAPGGHGA